MTADAIFEKAGFTHEYRESTEAFYRPFFASDEEMTDFFVSVFNNDLNNNVPRKMMNQIQRFISLANDIEIIRPGYDAFRILFLRICLESLAKLSDVKTKEFYNEFPHCFSPEGEEYILDNFKVPPFIEIVDDEEKYIKPKLKLSEFFDIIRITRNLLVHEGNFWEMQFFVHDDMACIVTFKTDEKVIMSYKSEPEADKKIQYCFETTLRYEEFIFHFVKACIKYVQAYIVSHLAEST